MQSDGQVKPSSNIQSQPTMQTLQPVAAAPTDIASVGTLARSRFHWYHAVFAVGLLAASGAGTAVLIKVSVFSIVSFPKRIHHFIFSKICHMLIPSLTSYSVAISSSCLYLTSNAIS